MIEELLLSCYNKSHVIDVLIENVTGKKHSNIKGLITIERMIFSLSNDVTGFLIFNKNVEVFMDYAEIEKKDNKIFIEDQEDRKISNGVKEEVNPLPVISALSKNFIKALEENKEAFIEEAENNRLLKPFNGISDTSLMTAIFKKTINDLNLHSSHLTEKSWIHPEQITTKEYLENHDILDSDEKEIAFPLTLEVFNLLHNTWNLHGKDRAYNTELSELFSHYVEYFRYLRIMKYPGYIFSQRIGELTFKPIIIHQENNEQDFSMATEIKNGLLSMAWAELYFAKLYEMPISLCTYCGQVFTITKNPNQSTCGNSSCLKKRRKERDLQNKEMNPDFEKEKQRLRQQQFRERKKAIRLYEKGYTLQQIRKEINKGKKFNDLRQIDEIQAWLNKYTKK